jgi:hypothetical protein
MLTELATRLWRWLVDTWTGEWEQCANLHQQGIGEYCLRRQGHIGKHKGYSGFTWK